MADLTARRESLLDYLPGDWQQAINTSPVVNALSRMINRPTPNLERGIEHDQYGNVADRNWLLEQARGGQPKMNPLAAEMLEKGGLLANFLGPGVKLPAMAPKPTGIRAYHGSPHDFDRFDMSKIGTGEGAQAYGRGLYFAENEGVARSYRDALGGRGVVSPYAQSVLSVANGDYDAAIKAISARIENPGAFPLGTGELQQARKAISDLTQARDAGVRLGRMYEVNIKADPDQFLDWDLPLSQQPEGVRKILPDLKPDAAGRDVYEELATRLAPPVPPEADRGWTSVVNTINDRVQSPQRATQALRDAGIPGIKYLDQQSRNMDPRIAAQERHIAYLERQPNPDPARIAEQRQHLERLRSEDGRTRNYVVFDDKLIEILRKYGLLPPVAAGTAAVLNQQEPQQ